MSLRSRLFDYVQAAGPLFAAAAAEERSRPSQVGWPSWHRDPDGIFRQFGREELGWSLRLGGRLEELAEYRAALTALMRDAKASTHLDTLVGSPFGGFRLEPDRLLWTFAHASLSKEGVDLREAFAAVYDSFKTWLADETVESIFLTPLAGVVGDIDSPLRLSEVTELDRLTDDEVIRGLNIGAIRPFSGPIFQNQPAAWGIRVRTRVKKLIGDHAFADLHNSDELNRYGARTLEETSQALVALRLQRRGKFSALAHLSYQPGLFGGGGTSYSVLSAEQHGWSTYRLTADDGRELPGLAAALRSRGVERRQFVKNALRRFSYAEERTRADDKLLDLMIAAESLFLGHMSEREGELRFRVAVHAAHLLGSTTPRRREIAKQMKFAYDTRSDIVHGGVPSPEKWGSKPSKPVSLDEFVESTADLMRSALKTAVMLSNETRGRGHFIDWDLAIFGG